MGVFPLFRGVVIALLISMFGISYSFASSMPDMCQDTKQYERTVEYLNALIDGSMLSDEDKVELIVERDLLLKKISLCN